MKSWGGAMRRHRWALAPLLIALCPALYAQCEPSPEVRRILRDKLSEKALQEMKFTVRVAFRRQVLEELIAKYPREVEPYRRLIQVTKQEDIDSYPALVDRYRKQAEQRPGDPLALYIAGLSLSGTDTPQSIRLLEQSRSRSPGFPWPALELAHIYSPGAKRVDQNKAAGEITAFFAACPSSTDAEAQRRLDRAGSKELQARVAAALRARLATETDADRLKDYKTLWGLEFRTIPPAEHAALRKQVAADLQRLESLNHEPDAAWLVFLKDGAKQSGASPETVTAMEDRVIQAFPHSDEAYRIVSDHWDKSHKEPEDRKDTVAWDKYNREYDEALKGWVARFTDSRELQHVVPFDAICDEPDVPAEAGLRALDDYLKYVGDYQPPSFSTYLQAAEFLVDHKWQPQRALDLLRGFDKLMDQWHALVWSDNLTAELEEMWTYNEAIRRQAAAGYVLVAARLAEQPHAADRVQAFVERELPPKSSPWIQPLYWQNRGSLAALQGSKADALTYYQKALHARKGPPEFYQGHRVHDALMDEARALWQQLGGTETAWKLWSTPPAAKIQEQAESGFKNPGKTMPAFELADLSGKTWRLKDLAGRAVLINVWATWCGPCQRELPHLEKLYEKVKDRSDLQILTLTIDEDLGAVAPFMQERGYNFPVLPAYTFVTGLLDVVAIPQNWIVDAKGEWRWTGAPAVPDAEWEAAMLKQLESATVHASPESPTALKPNAPSQ
ncbi:MAG: TlpA disulfide reductase family protein [Bryobacteraceae bacterium]|jgi:thiol-disulfide isomerase/thioredoxin